MHSALLSRSVLPFSCFVFGDVSDDYTRYEREKEEGLTLGVDERLEQLESKQRIRKVPEEKL